MLDHSVEVFGADVYNQKYIFNCLINKLELYDSPGTIKKLAILNFKVINTHYDLEDIGAQLF